MNTNKIAFLSDIHGNLHALETVLRILDLREIRHLICLGDVLGYGAHPVECFRLMRKRFTHCLLGNHEAALLAPQIPPHYRPEVRESLQHHRNLLSKEYLRYLASLPLVLEKSSYTASHGSIAHPEAFAYVIDEETALQHFQYQKGNKISFCGHTHRAGVWIQENNIIRHLPPENFVLKPDTRVLVDVGSVGQPRDFDPRASVVIYDPSKSSVEFLRVEYDVDQAAQDILDKGMAQSFAARLSRGA
jgi:predicted phosphodiesterase